MQRPKRFCPWTRLALCLAAAGSLAAVSCARRAPEQFIDKARTFSFSYPREFEVDDTRKDWGLQWRARAVGPGEVLALIEIPDSYAPKTNFRGATFRVARTSDGIEKTKCLSLLEQLPGTKLEGVNIRGATFAKYSFSDARAGDILDTVSYRIQRDTYCYIVEYTIHSSEIGNRTPDKRIHAFDKAKASQTLDAILRSFAFL